MYIAEFQVAYDRRPDAAVRIYHWQNLGEFRMLFNAILNYNDASPSYYGGGGRFGLVGVPPMTDQFLPETLLCPQSVR